MTNDIVYLKTQAELANYLASNHIDTSKWGQGEAKKVSDLWTEIEKGETQISENPVQRITTLCQVMIRNGEKILVETLQLFADGRVRVRNKPPAEKMLKDESWETAAVRGLVEELGATPDQIHIDRQSYMLKEKVQDSQSYPGLETRYVIHQVEAQVDRLPNSAFWTLEDVANAADAVRTHCWDWQRSPASSLTLNEYQAKAQRTAGAGGDGDRRLIIAALGLAGEAGEFANMVKKKTAHGHTNITPEKLAEELGDILWYAAEAASTLKLDLGDIGHQNNQKLAKRYPGGFSQERSRNRKI